MRDGKKLLRRRSFWLTLVITGFFIWLFLQGTNFREVGRELTQANYWFIIPAVLVYFVGVWFRAWRWQLLLQPVGKTTAIRLFPVMIIAYMINDIIPGRVGIVARAYMGGDKANINKVTSAATIVMEIILDGLALLFLVMVVAPFVPWDPWAKILLLSVVAFTVLSVAFITFLAFGEDLSRRIFRPLKKLLPSSWGDQLSKWLARFVEGLRILRSPGRMIPVFMISLLAWLSETATYYFVSLAFNLGLAYYSLLVVTAFASMAWALVVVSPGGLGAFDFVGKKALGVFAVSEGLATTYITVLHAVLILPVVLLGFIFLWWENVSFSKVTQLSMKDDKSVPQSVEEDKEQK